MSVNWRNRLAMAGRWIGAAAFGLLESSLQPLVGSSGVMPSELHSATGSACGRKLACRRSPSALRLEGLFLRF